MHELSIATTLVRTAAESAESNGAARVVKVRVSLGALSGVEPAALSFCFPVAARETICDGAELDITIVPARGACPRCRAAVEVNDLMAPCPACGEWPLAVDGGREMLLVSLEVV
jgi:hydrogenase nickel incorporation protein HypA/HybF